MSTPQDPGRPEDQPRYPDAPPPPEPQQPQQPQQPPYAGGPAGSAYGDPYAGGAAGSAYGNPYASPGFGSPPTRPDLPPPREVVWTTYAMYAAIAFSLINLVIALADAAGFKDTIREANADRNVDVDAVYTGVVVSFVLITLVISAVYVFLAINLRKGRNWARITAFIVVGFFTLLGLARIGSDVPGIVRLLNILVLLANAAVLVLLAMRPSSRFFAAMKQPQQPRF